MARSKDGKIIRAAGGIRKKITVAICLSILALLIIGVSLGYMWAFVLMRNTVGDDHEKMAAILASGIGDIIEHRVETMEGYASDIVWVNAADEKNLMYRDMDTETMRRYFSDMDIKWTDGSPEDPLVKDILDNGVSEELKAITEKDRTVAEIFITDARGGLVAASEKTSDFYQADERWWQKAYNGGRGDMFLGDVEYDKSSGVMSITFAAPMVKDGRVVGICKAVLNFEFFIKPLKKVKIGKSGHVSLIDKEGKILFHEGMRPYERKILSGEKVGLMIGAKKRWDIITANAIHVKPVFTAWAKVEEPLLEKEGISWLLLISQDREEVFRPLYALIFQGMVISIFLILIIIPVGYSLGAGIVEPIRKLQDATARIAAGSLDHRVDLKTGDELEDLADSFNKMTDYLRKSTTSIKNLNAEIAERKRIGDELRRALEEEVRSREIMTSMLEDNSQIRERLEKSIRELQDTQNQLIQAEKMEAIGRMASGVAHEVKNPLGIILQGIDYLEMVLPADNKDNRETLQMMRKGVMRADGIVRALLDFARAEKLNAMPQDINAVIESSIISVGHRLKSAGIEVVREMKDGLPDALIDAGKVEQVLINLLNNAADAMQRGGKLYVRSYQSAAGKAGGKGSIVVEVEDTGAGMDEGVKGKIFEPFFTTKDRTQGTGLGLSIAKSIVDLHNGSINVESHKGKGTKVTLAFRSS
ncbi:MAG: ATP-binding protein [Candidatus Omnitrophota bacterium]